MDDIELRQYCLENALKFAPDNSSEDIIEFAKAFYDFITNKEDAHLKSSL